MDSQEHNSGSGGTSCGQPAHPPSSPNCVHHGAPKPSRSVFEPFLFSEPIAIVSDIHANLEALEAVQDDIRRQGISRIFCLGDIINYGPDPEACIEAAMAYELVLMGNHEDAVLKEPVGFNPIAAMSAKWTRRRLKKKKRELTFLAELPDLEEVGHLTFVHASLRDRLFEYILPSDMCCPGTSSSECVRENMTLTRGVCFVGHTHIPGVFEEDGTYRHPSAIKNGYTVDGSKKLIVNVGSVGQPRDGDTRASYVIFDGLVVRHRRIPYDLDKTMRKIVGSAGLHVFNAGRLRYGQ